MRVRITKTCPDPPIALSDRKRSHSIPRRHRGHRVQFKRELMERTRRPTSSGDSQYQPHQTGRSFGGRGSGRLRSSSCKFQDLLRVCGGVHGHNFQPHESQAVSVVSGELSRVVLGPNGLTIGLPKIGLAVRFGSGRGLPERSGSLKIWKAAIPGHRGVSNTPARNVGAVQ